MRVYDHFYANDSSVFQQQYDFITATEVVEHLHHPDRELHRLWDHLKPGGHLGIMTKLAPTRDMFTVWHYKNDPTHICFYADATFRWLADQWKSNVAFEDQDVMIFKKRSGP